MSATKQSLLGLAVSRIGKPELAKRMNTAESLIEAWMSGHASMPDRKLLLLADIIEQLGDDPKADK